MPKLQILEKEIYNEIFRYNANKWVTFGYDHVAKKYLVRFKI